jgi:hypothetical protein
MGQWLDRVTGVDGSALGEAEESLAGAVVSSSKYRHKSDKSDESPAVVATGRHCLDCGAAIQAGRLWYYCDPCALAWPPEGHS